MGAAFPGPYARRSSSYSKRIKRYQTCHFRVHLGNRFGVGSFNKFQQASVSFIHAEAEPSPMVRKHKHITTYHYIIMAHCTAFLHLSSCKMALHCIAVRMIMYYYDLFCWLDISSRSSWHLRCCRRRLCFFVLLSVAQVFFRMPTYTGRKT